MKCINRCEKTIYVCSKFERLISGENKERGRKSDSLPDNNYVRNEWTMEFSYKGGRY